jgi:hypothetical protein
MIDRRILDRSLAVEETQQQRPNPVFASVRRPHECQMLLYKPHSGKIFVEEIRGNRVGLTEL